MVGYGWASLQPPAKLEVEAVLTVGRDEAGEVGRGGREVVEEVSWLVGVLRIWGQKAPPEVYFKIPECVRGKSLGHSGGRGGFLPPGHTQFPTLSPLLPQPRLS